MNPSLPTYSRIHWRMIFMRFKKIHFNHAFYDNWTDQVFYAFYTAPQIDHGEWAISAGGDTAYDLCSDVVTQTDFPEELLELIEYIPNNVKVEGLDYE